LYVGSISWELDAHQAKEAIGELCRPFSTDCEVEVPWLDKKKKKVQKHRGFAFVSFPDATVAAAAMNGLAGAELAGRGLTVRTATVAPEKLPVKPPEESRPRGRNHVKLYVGGLPVEVKDAEALKAMFVKCGTVVDSKIMKDKQGVPRGYGFVTLATERAATKALNMHGSYLQGHYVQKGGTVGWDEERKPIIVNTAD